MGALKKKKKENSTEEIKQEDTTKVEKKMPVKAQPVKAGWNFRDNVGGIFTSKVAAIMRKLLGKE
jgi:hypothetical protein